MSQNPSSSRTLALVLGLLVLGAIPLGMWWQKQPRGESAVARLVREKQVSMDVVAGIAKKDLACDAVEVRDTTDGMFATGCEKRARYVLGSNGFHREGDIEPADRADDSSGCKTTWTASAEDAGTTTTNARRAIEDARAKKHAVRLRVPIEATGIRGLEKLRWGPFIEVFVEPGDAAELRSIVVPCPSMNPGPAPSGTPGGDAAAGDASAGVAAPTPTSASVEGSACTVPFERATEVADCP